MQFSLRTFIKKTIVRMQNISARRRGNRVIMWINTLKIKRNKNITLSDPNKLRLKECSKYLEANFVGPDHKDIQSNSLILF